MRWARHSYSISVIVPQALGSDEALAAKEADDEADDADDDEELEEAQLLAEFERMDLDKDNKVSEDEYVQVCQAPPLGVRH